MTVDHEPTLSGKFVEVQQLHGFVENPTIRRYDPSMTDHEPEINITRPRPPFDSEILDKLGAEIGSCPDVAFAHLCDVEVVGRGDGPGPVLFVWLVSRAVRSLKPALNLVSEAVARALPEDRFVDVVILNSVPELLQPVEAAGCLLVERDPEERRVAVAAGGADREIEDGGVSRRWWWPF